MTTATAQALHVGQILQGSFGYDMTINQFFVIQRLTDNSVWIREVAAIVSNDNGNGNGTAVADPALEPVGPLLRRKIKQSGIYGPYVNHGNCCSLSPWNGRPVYHNTYD